MFERILIANRGEIALRIIRACRELDIETVVVYSKADAGASYLDQADEAICIGPGPSAQVLPRDAQHHLRRRDRQRRRGPPGLRLPGGERALRRGLPRQQHRVHRARRRRRSVGSATRPEARRCRQGGRHPRGRGQRRARERRRRAALEVAHKVGYPVLIKAVSGGGGRGHAHRAQRHLASCTTWPRRAPRPRRRSGTPPSTSRSTSADPRHVEFQILGDRQGNVVHLGDRDCSVQRRHQKVIEESPSPGITPDLRAQDGARPR